MKPLTNIEDICFNALTAIRESRYQTENFFNDNNHDNSNEDDNLLLEYTRDILNSTIPSIDLNNPNNTSISISDDASFSSLTAKSHHKYKYVPLVPLTRAHPPHLQALKITKHVSKQPLPEDYDKKNWKTRYSANSSNNGLSKHKTNFRRGVKLVSLFNSLTPKTIPNGTPIGFDASTTTTSTSNSNSNSNSMDSSRISSPAETEPSLPKGILSNVLLGGNSINTNDHDDLDTDRCYLTNIKELFPHEFGDAVVEVDEDGGKVLVRYTNPISSNNVNLNVSVNMYAKGTPKQIAKGLTPGALNKANINKHNITNTPNIKNKAVEKIRTVVALDEITKLVLKRVPNTKSNKKTILKKNNGLTITTNYNNSNKNSGGSSDNKATLNQEYVYSDSEKWLTENISLLKKSHELKTVNGNQSRQRIKTIRKNARDAEIGRIFL